jgi:hypothetical protein
MLLNFGLMLVNFEIGFTRAISAAIIGAKKFDGFGE